MELVATSSGVSRSPRISSKNGLAVIPDHLGRAVEHAAPSRDQRVVVVRPGGVGLHEQVLPLRAKSTVRPLLRCGYPVQSRFGAAEVPRTFRTAAPLRLGSFERKNVGQA